MAAIIVNLECITNMHVGNGDVNYNIIDNEVEKDPITGYPTINAIVSSISFITWPAACALSGRLK